MIQKTTVTLDSVKGTATFSIDLQGASEFEHEILAAIFSTSRSVTVVPTHRNEILSAEFTVTDETIWPRAAHALENRKRVANGLPTIEQEEAQVALREKADKEKADAEADAQKKEKAKAQAAQDKDDERIAKIASKVAADLIAKMGK